MNWKNNYSSFKSEFSPEFSGANEKRNKSFEDFLTLGLPTKRDEAWKYTSLEDFKNIDWKLHDENESHLTHEQMQEISRKLPSGFINFVFVNGILNQTLSDDADDLISSEKLTENDFEPAKNVEVRLLNLARTFLKKKIIISLPKQKIITKPVQIVFIQSSSDPVYLSEKLNIHLAENSEMKLIIKSMSFINSTANAININVNIRVEKSARLTFVQLQNENQESFHFSQTELQLDSLAQVTSLVLSLGSKLTRNYFHLKFSGENSLAAVYGLGVLGTSQHLDNYTFIQHATGNNHSIQHYKSILSGSAHSAFRGRVLIEPNAQKADSEQLNNNLLLTRTAQADSVPQLEIFADDVKAGHGATFGQLSKDEIFYFLSRGINQYQAVKMLSYGFAKELVYKIENETMQNYLIAALNQQLDQLVQNA